jgi:para-nitrobenzyl esterase
MRMRGAWIIAALIVLAACGGDDEPDPVRVDTTSGPVRGFRQGDTRAWLGLPFAAPPVGDLRFRAPGPAPTWTEERAAVAVGPQCPQTFGFSAGGGGEDCLYLNVWAPAEPPAAPAPVMVWFHGGAFIFGSGGDPYYRGEALAARHGVIIVTVNYRLGPLGFLAHPALEDGNAGIEDQIAALAWVRDNIAGFGGDAGRVTVWGESAGGYSACVHYLSPRSRGLFHRVISQSGLCSGDGLRERTRAEAEADGVAFATEAGCPGTGAGAAACLRAIDPFTLVEAGDMPPVAEQLPGGLYFQDDDPARWRPHVDGDVLLAPLAEGFAAADAPPVPLLLGTNRDEGTFFVWSVIARAAADETEVRDALARRFGTAAVDAIVAQYPVASYPTPSLALAAISGDAFFVCPARRTARLVAATGAPVFLYAFAREPENGLIADGGVFHAAEIPFVFGIDEFPLGKVGSAGKPVSDAMMRYWTRFATTGSPDGDGDPAWPAHDAAGDAHLTIDLTIAAGTGHVAASCDFWDARAI